MKGIIPFSMLLLLWLGCAQTQVVEVNNNTFVVPLSLLPDTLDIDSVRVQVRGNSEHYLDTLVRKPQAGSDLRFPNIMSNADEDLIYHYSVYAGGVLVLSQEERIAAHDAGSAGTLPPDMVADDSTLVRLFGVPTPSSSSSLSSSVESPLSSSSSWSSEGGSSSTTNLSSSAPELSSSTQSSSDSGEGTSSSSSQPNSSSSPSLLVRKVTVSVLGEPLGVLSGDTFWVDPTRDTSITLSVVPNPGYTVWSLASDHENATPVVASPDQWTLHLAPGVLPASYQLSWGPTIQIEYPSSTASWTYIQGSANLKKTETLSGSISSLDPKLWAFAGWQLTHGGSGAISSIDTSVVGSIKLQQSAGYTIIKPKFVRMWNSTLTTRTNSITGIVKIFLNQDGHNGYSLLYPNGSTLSALVLDSNGVLNKEEVSQENTVHTFTTGVIASQPVGSFVWGALSEGINTVWCADRYNLSILTFAGECDRYLDGAYHGSTKTTLWGIHSISESELTVASSYTYPNATLSTTYNAPLLVTFASKVLTTTRKWSGDSVSNNFSVTSAQVTQATTGQLFAYSRQAGSQVYKTVLQLHDPSGTKLQGVENQSIRDVYSLEPSTHQSGTWLLGGRRHIQGATSSAVARVQSDLTVSFAIVGSTPPSTNTVIHCVRELKDGRIVALGWDSGTTTGYLAVYSSDLQTILWSRNNLSKLYLTSLVEAVDGRIILAGTTESSPISLTLGPYYQWPW